MQDSPLWLPEGQEGLVAKLRRVTLVKTDDSGTQQKMKLRGLKSEELDEIVRILPHGFSSNPPVDAEGIILSLGGRSDRALVLGIEHKDHRPKNLPLGTSILYDDKGNVIFVKGSDGIFIDAKEGKVYVKPGAGQNVYLGGTGADGSYAKVVTEAGPAINVFAKIG
jgi:phage baseplate assembly protein V